MAYADSYRMAKNPVSTKSGAAIISVSFSYEFPYQRRIRLKSKTSDQKGVYSAYTPAQRHARLDTAILSNRKVVYEAAKSRRPERWSRQTRHWEPVQVVYLNPDKSCDSSRLDTLEKAA